VDSKTSPVIGNPRKADRTAPIARSKAPHWCVGTEKRMLRSKAPGISIFGNGQEVTYLLSEGNGQARVYPKLGLIVGEVATKDKPLGRRGVGWHVWWCVMVAPNGSGSWRRRRRGPYDP